VGEGAKRFPVVAKVNGYAWRSSVTRMRGEFLLGLNRSVRQEARVEAGDTVEVEIELDTAPREVVVLQLLAQGQTNREIARLLGVSVGTVKVHVQHIIAKLGVSDRTQAAVRAVELGLLTAPRR